MWLQVEIDILNEESNEVSKDYAGAALPTLFPLMTSCLVKQVGPPPVCSLVCVCAPECMSVCVFPFLCDCAAGAIRGTVHSVHGRRTVRWNAGTGVRVCVCVLPFPPTPSHPLRLTGHR